MEHMLQDQLLNQVVHCRMLINELLKKYPDIVSEESALTILDSKSYAVLIRMVRIPITLDT